MTEQEMLAKIEELQAQNEKLKAEKAKAGTIRLKISEKGGLSVYGLGRFPVTLYKSQWLSLFGHAEEIAQFMKDNDSKLATKAAA